MSENMNFDYMIVQMNKYSDFNIYNLTMADLKSKLDADLIINESNIEDILFSVNTKTSAWLKRFITISRLACLAEDEMNKTYRSKYHYYKFEFDQDHKIDRNDVKHYVVSDDDYLRIKYTYDNLKHILKFLENALKKVSELTFTIESIVDWKKYMSGKQ